MRKAALNYTHNSVGYVAFLNKQKEYGLWRNAIERTKPLSLIAPDPRKVFLKSAKEVKKELKCFLRKTERVVGKQIKYYRIVKNIIKELTHLSEKKLLFVIKCPEVLSPYGRLNFQFRSNFVLNSDLLLFVSAVKQVLFLFNLKTNMKEYEAEVKTNLNGIVRWPGTTLEFSFPSGYEQRMVIFKHKKGQIEIYCQNKMIYKLSPKIFLSNKAKTKLTECMTINSLRKSAPLKIKRFPTIPGLKGLIIPHDVLRICTIQNVFHGIREIWPEAKRSILKYTKQIIFTKDGDSGEMWANTSGLYLGTTLINTGNKYNYLDVAEIIIHENEHNWYGYLRMLSHDFAVEEKLLKTPWGRLSLEQLINEVNAYMASTLFRLRTGLSIKNRRDSIKLCNSAGEDIENMHTAINILGKHEEKMNKFQKKLLTYLKNRDLSRIHLPESSLLAAMEAPIKLKV